MLADSGHRMQNRILVVDDEAEIRQLLVFNLARAGYAVAEAADGEDGYLQALASVPDLIVLDVMLPHIDGFAVCELLRRNERTRQIPVILLTACSSEDSRVVGFESGADDYMAKPFSPRELLARIERLLRAREAMKRLAESTPTPAVATSGPAS
jgi:DNA-binding response OmpR family regulator